MPTSSNPGVTVASAMFDVSWTAEAAGETVGQRRQRKDREAERGEVLSRRGSFQTSSSSGASSHTKASSRNKSSSSGWGFFSGKKPDSKDVKGKGKHRSETPISTPVNRTVRDVKDGRGNDDRSSRNDLRDRDMITISPPPTPVDSVFSVPTIRSKNDSSWGGSVSDHSSSRYDYGGRSIRDSHLLPPDEEPEYQSPEITSFYQDRDSMISAMDDMSITQKRTDFDFAIDQSHQFPRVPRAPSRSQGRAAHHSPPPMLRSKPPATPLPLPPLPDNSAIRLRVRRMEVASPKIVLQRLVEEWDEDEDEGICNELAFEKQLWLLMGLRYIRKKTNPDFQTGVIMEPCKVLSLYESHACANLLSTIYPPGSKTHHLSLTPPLSIEQASHLQTMIITTPTTNLPYPPSNFTTITSLRLPVLFPASSIPIMLQECHRLLLPSGTLQLTILDPLPIAASLGPKLRAWLDDHLLFKLETQFRCLRPIKFMPIWLENAGFQISPDYSTPDRGATVRITEENLQSQASQSVPHQARFSFRAVGKREGGFGGSSKGRGDEVVETLASTVGRMLWKEIYGPFVVGDNWWWEDDEIVREAYDLGTRWDVVTFDAVKETKR